MPFVIHFTYLDSQKNGAFAVEYFSDAPDFVSAVAESSDLRDAIAPLTDCTLGYRSVELVLERSRTRPSGNVDGEKKALFPYITQAGKVMTRTIPGFKSAKFVTGTDLVNMADADVAGYTSQVISGTITDSNNSDIIAVEQAVKQFASRQN